MDWKKTVGDIAPLIAGALSGGNPIITALTGAMVKKALGLPPEATDENICQATQNDPDALVKIKQAEIELKEKLSQNNVDIETILAASTADARKMQIITRDKTPMYLTIITMIIFLTMLWFVCKRDIPSAMHDTFMLMLGLVISCVKDIYRFFFG